jgi:hypothetical protein
VISLWDVDLDGTYVPVDEYFGTPFFDGDEERTDPYPHRYVHGGFSGTDARFTFYFPPTSVYQRRFFTSIEGGPGGHENRAAAMNAYAGPHGIDFAALHGAFLIESNGGHIASPGLSRGRSLLDGGITSFRASAESTRLARWLSTQIYGVAPQFGYIFGPSGGGWRTILCIENTRGIWNGAVPYISPAGLGVSFPSIVSNLVRVLGDTMASVVAASEPGSESSPFDGLSSSQRFELATAYRAGLQPGSEFQLLRPAPELNVLLTTSVMHSDFDAEYFEAFWTEPGYLGADGDLSEVLVDTTVVVGTPVTVGDVRVIDAHALDYFIAGGLSLDDQKVVGVRVRGNTSTMERLGRLARGCTVGVISGAKEGRQLACLGATGDILILDDATGDLIGSLQDGDELRLDNRRYLAYCNAYRYQIDTDAAECRQFMIGGEPIYPQRTKNVADVLAGVRTTGEIETKTIYVSNTKDTLASPLGGSVQWAAKVRSVLGPDASDRLRVWVNDNAAHLLPQNRPPGDVPVASTRIVDYTGVVERAIDHVIAWVEKGIAPPADTAFNVDEGRINLAANAGERGGVQPVVSAMVNGQVRTNVLVGEVVHFEVRIDVPPGGGFTTTIEWDFEGRGDWPELVHVGGGDHSGSTSHSFALPGTFYPSVRVTTQLPGALDTRFGLVRNLARVRVDVS